MSTIELRRVFPALEATSLDGVGWWQDFPTPFITPCTHCGHTYLVSNLGRVAIFHNWDWLFATMHNELLYFYCKVSCVSCLIRLSISTIYYFLYAQHLLSFVSIFVFFALLRFCILACEKIKIRVNHHVVECYCAGILNGNTFLAGWTPSGQS